RRVQQLQEDGKRSRVGVNWKMDDEAEKSGLVFFGRTGEELDDPGIKLFQTLGCGGGTLDFDRDGWQDVYLAAAGGMPPERDSKPNQLFRNLEGRFMAVAKQARVGDTGFAQGIAVGDVNSDGFPDLLVLNYGPNRLFLNQGDGQFQDASARLPSEPYDEWSTCGGIADLDGDGLADLFFVNYCSGLGPVIQSCHARGTCSPMVFGACDDRIVQNSGDGSFQDQTNNWMENQIAGRGLGLVIGPLDDLAGNDCYVANDMTNNHLYLPRRDPSMSQMGEQAMVVGVAGDDRGIPQGSMGIATGDFEGDGDLDFFATNFDGEYHTLYVQDSPGIWQDRTAAGDLISSTLPHVGFGTEAIDIDNDGSIELALLNGHVDIFSRAGKDVKYRQPVQLFNQVKPLDFREVNSETLGEYFQREHVGRSLWTIDANRDGKIDLLATHQTEPVALLINQTPTENSWMRVELVGTNSNRDAIGSKVTLEIAGKSLAGFRVAAGGFQCSNERFLHFGLGKVDGLVGSATATVIWPNGIEESFGDLPLNQVSTLCEGNGDGLDGQLGGKYP
ncbi:MAG: CRTAC1 family protein, partial [Planctomycetota bacterium]